ncbi:zinc finger protein ZAT2-like [Henckelia pumila]|uniref:zinc finger protein ZAT2-like n=1 Tax=Henckelia pumila TaxID=405737 RepID=UPI003C6DCBC0
MDNRSSDLHPPSTVLSLSPLRQEPTTCFAKQNPRKKRSKTHTAAAAGAASCRLTKSTRKPDPAAPKITRPCTECGKRFWSWKALFGHMRCHPEREWRGINPPPNLRRRHVSEDSSAVTEEDHEVASCLLLLANGDDDDDDDQESPSTACTVDNYQGTSPIHSFDLYYYYHLENNNNNNNNSSSNNDRGFECSSCKKVFGSHQALGGHRASHKNVKGCYAIAMNHGDDQEHSIEGDSTHDNQTVPGHKCGICMRVFSSGQALGGHKRCHWEKAAAEEAGILDLNFPAVDGEDQEYASSYSSIDSAYELCDVKYFLVLPDGEDMPSPGYKDELSIFGWNAKTQLTSETTNYKNAYSKINYIITHSAMTSNGKNGSGPPHFEIRRLTKSSSFHFFVMPVYQLSDASNAAVVQLWMSELL